MPVFVIAPLLLKEADAERIATLRRVYDPNAAMVPPHVTLVFAVDDGLEARAVAWAQSCARGSMATSLRYTRAAVTRDYENSAWYLFLMPREIPAKLAELHRRLNGGSLAGAAADVAFDAHLTLGRFQERVLAEAVARDANDSRVGIDVEIAGLRVLRFDGAAVRSSVDIALGAA
jgi:2'-5' RNA ligase